MLKLGADQFAKIAELRFERKLVGAICGVDPSAAPLLSSSEGLTMLRLQCQRARGVGMQMELDVSRYVVTAWLLGPDFDTRFPAIAAILATERLSPTQKADAIERICTAVLLELRQGRA